MFDDPTLTKPENGGATLEGSEVATPSLDEQVKTANERADDNYGKFLLAMADFENYKKRIQRDIESVVTNHRRHLLERFLPVLDNLERALASNAGGDGLRNGIEQTLRGFEAVLAGEGVKAIEVIGKPFDPRFAEAIGTAPGDGLEDDTVVTVAEKGYSIGEELLRPAKVLVAKRDG